MPNISLIGFDVHKIVRNMGREVKGLLIGGVVVEEKYRFLAHSDGDILIHAIIDALSTYTIGKDIGELFPDNDSMYKNNSSVLLLKKVLEMIDNRFIVSSIDTVIVIDKVKISPIKEQIISNLQNYFNNCNITIKGKRTEGGFKKNYGYCWAICNIECK